MMGWYHDGGGGGGWLVMTLAMLAFWVLVVGAVVLLFRDTGHGRTATPAAPSDPWRILDERFALGQIGPEEYRERRAVLAESQQGHPRPTTPENGERR
jgi:putative membrane protein